MTRMQTSRFYAEDPLWEGVKDTIRNDTVRGRKNFDEMAFLELKYLLCVKCAWGDTEGGEYGLFGATSLQCDKLWHTFLLNTKNYELYCRRLFIGKYIHHGPVWNRAASDRLLENARTVLRVVFNVEFAGISKVSRPISPAGKREKNKIEPSIDVGPISAKKIKLGDGGPDPCGPDGGRNDDSGDSEGDECFFNCA